MRRIVVTGAQGFIGRYFVSHALMTDPSVNVIGLGRSPESSRHFTHTITWRGCPVTAPLPGDLAAATASSRYSYMSVDLNDQRRVAEVLMQTVPDTIVHLAAALRDDPPERLVSSNVGSVVSLLEAIAGSDLPRPRLVLGSSGSVYGLPTRLPIHESDPCLPRDPYAVSKLAAENMARVLAERYGLSVCWARIFNPLGPGQDERHVGGRICSQLAAAIVEGVAPSLALGALDNTRDFLDVRDVAQALWCLATAGRAGTVYNVGSGVQTSVQRLVDLAVAGAGVEETARLERLPARRDDIPHTVPCIDALSALGFACQIGVGESLRETLQYYLDLDTSVGQMRVPAAESNAFRVELQRRHAYAVHIQRGLFDTLPERLLVSFAGRKHVVLSDQTVGGMYGAALVDGLRASGVDAHLLMVDEGESFKSLRSFERLIGELHRLGVARRSLLVNLGGGMICDLGGFVASTYLRGIPYVNVPTSLVAQHDAAVGGKVAVNTTWAKNFVGAFHHPSAVYCDPSLLVTLDVRDVSSGIAEAIKVAVCGAAGLFRLLETSVPSILERRDADVLEDVVRRCVERKIELLAPDPLETDLRRALNLGHTLAHPLEVEFEFEGIRHGEAVALGLAVATQVAVDLGVCASKDAERIFWLLAAYDLPPVLPLERCEEACGRLSAIRLARGGTLHFVLPTSTESIEIVPEIEHEMLVKALRAVAAHPALARSLAA